MTLNALLKESVDVLHFSLTVQQYDSIHSREVRTNTVTHFKLAYKYDMINNVNDRRGRVMTTFFISLTHD